MAMNWKGLLKKITRKPGQAVYAPLSGTFGPVIYPILIKLFISAILTENVEGAEAMSGVPEDSSEASDTSVGNFSEYEERVKEERKAARSGTDTQSQAVSPRGNSSFLDDKDYGIQLEDLELHDKKSLLMTEDLIGKLHSGLPSRWRIASTWSLLYSTNFHGYSLSTLLGRSKGFPGPVIIIIRATDGSIFGAFTTEPFHPHIGHFGTGECFLWKQGQDGRIKRFKSTGSNDYFMLCETEFIAVGCGEGRFGLWIDGQLESGQTHAVSTFDNEPLALGENFECAVLEVWGLICDEL